MMRRTTTRIRVRHRLAKVTTNARKAKETTKMRTREGYAYA
jgi:hypothetical protein